MATISYEIPYTDEKKTVTIKLSHAEQEGKRWALYYSMGDDRTNKLQPPYHIPKDNLSFIEEAIRQQILIPGASLKVTMSRIGKVWRWTEIQERF